MSELRKYLAEVDEIDVFNVWFQDINLHIKIAGSTKEVIP
jgi:hypothetical protein